MAITTTDTSLLRLLQLSSATLPVGGYSFSQGLEAAVEAGWLHDMDQTHSWLSMQLLESQAQVDVPLLLRQLQAAKEQDVAALKHWNAWLLACRETSELRLADTAMGAALLRLAEPLAITIPWRDPQETSFVTVFAMVATHWQIEPRLACHGFLWSWLENQVAAATKLVPLGQTQAQQLLGQLMADLPVVIDRAENVADDAIGASLPALAMASSWHETQYSRLFRS